MIHSGTWLTGRVATVVAGTAIALGAVAGLGQGAAVAAPPPGQLPAYTYTMTNLATNQPSASTVTVSRASSATYMMAYTISLVGVTPNATYTIQGCYTSPSLNVVHQAGCISSTPSSIKTDPSGNATATVYFNNAQAGGVIDTVSATNSASKTTDAYRATVAGVIGYLPVVSVGLPGYNPPRFVPLPVH